MPRSKEGAAAPEQKVILSEEVKRDIDRLQGEQTERPLRRADQAVGRLREEEETTTKRKVKSLKEAMRELKEEGLAPTKEEAGRGTFEQAHQELTSHEPESKETQRIARTNEILGQGKAVEIWNTVTGKIFGLPPARATEYVHAVANLVDREEGLIKMRSLNKAFDLPEVYDPVTGSGASRPTAMRSLARDRIATTEFERPKLGSVPETESMSEAERLDTEQVLTRQYGVAPSQVYFKLGNVDPTVATIMQADSNYKKWVTELRTKTGELLKEEARHRESVRNKPHMPLDEKAAMREGLLRLKKGFEDEEQLEEEKFFEAGDRMTREAEEQRANLIELNDELHEELADFRLKTPTPRVNARIRMLARRIEETEQKLRGEFEEHTPSKQSLGERFTGWLKGIAKKFERTPREYPLPPEEDLETRSVEREAHPEARSADREAPKMHEELPALMEELPALMEDLHASRMTHTETGVIPPVVVGDEEVPAVAESRTQMKREVERRNLLPTEKEIEGRALLEFQWTLENLAVTNRKAQALQWLVDDYRTRARKGLTSDEYPGWTSKHFASAAFYVQSAIDEWKRKPLKRKKIVETPIVPQEITSTTKYPIAEIKPPAEEEITALARSLSEWKHSKRPEDTKLYEEMIGALRNIMNRRPTHSYFWDRGYLGWTKKHYENALRQHELFEKQSSKIEPRPTPEEIEEDAQEAIRTIRGGEKWFQQDVKHTRENIQMYRDAAEEPDMHQELGRGWNEYDFTALADRMEVLLAEREEREKTQNKKKPRQAA